MHSEACKKTFNEKRIENFTRGVEKRHTSEFNP